MCRGGQYASFEELEADLRKLIKKFFEYQRLDEKPAKGERKLADELAILIGDMIDEYIESHKDEETKLLDLYKIALFEIAYTESGYNFDIQIGLAKSFDRLGLCTSYSEAYTNLGLKGV